MRPSQVVSAAAVILFTGMLAAAQIRDHTAGGASSSNAAAASANAAAAGVAAIDIRLAGNVFTVTGWAPPARSPPGGWPAIFAVYASAAAGTSAQGLPALLGSYSIERGELVFRARFPFTAGMSYRAVFEPPGGPAVARTFYGPPRDETPSTRVVDIYPSGPVLPSNTLRLYIYFSAPMSRGEAYGYVHVLDGSGRELQRVFLPGEELWDPQFERLTLTFDPGRIKRGLTSNEAMGPPIAPGARYTLVIDRAWPDARGVPLAAGTRKPFRGGPALRSAPDPGQWRVSAPAAGSSAPLTVDFPTPMNYPLLQRMLRVTGPGGAIAGMVSIGREETRWRFTPQRPWRAGGYQLIVDRDLEDLAGNHIGQLFDIDEFQRVTEHIVTRTIALPFRVP